MIDYQELSLGTQVAATSMSSTTASSGNIQNDELPFPVFHASEIVEAEKIVCVANERSLCWSLLGFPFCSRRALD